MLNDKQLALRPFKCGVSELFWLLAGRWFKVWYPKATGNQPFTGEEDFIHLGNLLEGPAIEDYAWRQRNAGMPLQVVHTEDEIGDAITLEHPDLPLIGTPDGLCLRRASNLVIDMVPSREDGSIFLPNLEAIHEAYEGGILPHGLEIKTGAQVAEYHLSDEDQWGDDCEMQGLISCLMEDITSPELAERMASKIIRRWALTAQHTDTDGHGDDAYDVDLNNMPRQYYIQCLGYMFLTGIREWHLYRWRFARGQLEPQLYKILWSDEHKAIMEGAIEKLKQFTRDHMTPYGMPAQWTAPKPDTIDEQGMDLARLYPIDDGSIIQAGESDFMAIENWKEAAYEFKRWETRKKFYQNLIAGKIGDARQMKSSSGNFTYPMSKGRTSAERALQCYEERLSVEGIEPPPGLLGEALEESRGKSSRRFNGPRSVTAGVKAEETLRLLANNNDKE